ELAERLLDGERDRRHQQRRLDSEIFRRPERYRAAVGVRARRQVGGEEAAPHRELDAQPLEERAPLHALARAFFPQRRVGIEASLLRARDATERSTQEDRSGKASHASREYLTRGAPVSM